MLLYIIESLLLFFLLSIKASFDSSEQLSRNLSDHFWEFSLIKIINTNLLSQNLLDHLWESSLLFLLMSRVVLFDFGKNLKEFLYNKYLFDFIKIL